MTLAEIKTVLDAVGIPVAYDHFETEQAMPYIIYKETSTRTLSRDDSVGVKISTIQVELYTVTKNLTLEETLEGVLDSFIWNKTLDFDNEDEFYSSFYEFEILR